MSTTLNRGFTLIELMIVVAIIGVLAVIALPQYQNYVSRSQATRAMAEAGDLKAAVEVCINENRIVLGTAAGNCDPAPTGSSILSGPAQYGAALTPGLGVPQIIIDPVNGTTITATFGSGAVTTLTSVGNDSITWTRAADGSWRCSATIPLQYVPRGCN